MARTTRRRNREPALRREPWRDSRGRAIYNLALSAFALVMGVVMVVAPQVFGSSEHTRALGGVLAGYAFVRGLHFYRRLRALARRERS